MAQDSIYENQLIGRCEAIHLRILDKSNFEQLNKFDCKIGEKDFCTCIGRVYGNDNSTKFKNRINYLEEIYIKELKSTSKSFSHLQFDQYSLKSVYMLKKMIGDQNRKCLATPDNDKFLTLYEKELNDTQKAVQQEVKAYDETETRFVRRMLSAKLEENIRRKRKIRDQEKLTFIQKYITGDPNDIYKEKPIENTVESTKKIYEGYGYSRERLDHLYDEVSKYLEFNKRHDYEDGISKEFYGTIPGIELFLQHKGLDDLFLATNNKSDTILKNIIDKKCEELNTEIERINNQNDPYDYYLDDYLETVSNDPKDFFREISKIIKRDGRNFNDDQSRELYELESEYFAKVLICQGTEQYTQAQEQVIRLANEKKEELAKAEEARQAAIDARLKEESALDEIKQKNEVLESAKQQILDAAAAAKAAGVEVPTENNDDLTQISNEIKQNNEVIREKQQAVQSYQAQERVQNNNIEKAFDNKLQYEIYKNNTRVDTRKSPSRLYYDNNSDSIKVKSKEEYLIETSDFLNNEKERVLNSKVMKELDDSLSKKLVKNVKSDSQRVLKKVSQIDDKLITKKSLTNDKAISQTPTQFAPLSAQNTPAQSKEKQKLVNAHKGDSFPKTLERLNSDITANSQASKKSINTVLSNIQSKGNNTTVSDRDIAQRLQNINQREQDLTNIVKPLKSSTDKAAQIKDLKEEFTQLKKKIKESIDAKKEQEATLQTEGPVASQLEQVPSKINSIKTSTKSKKSKETTRSQAPRAQETQASFSQTQSSTQAIPSAPIATENMPSSLNLDIIKNEIDNGTNVISLKEFSSFSDNQLKVKSSDDEIPNRFIVSTDDGQFLIETVAIEGKPDQFKVISSIGNGDLNDILLDIEADLNIEKKKVFRLKSFNQYLNQGLKAK